MIVSCAVLHNLSKDLHDANDFEVQELMDEPNLPNPDEVDGQQLRARGQQRRATIADTL